MLNLPAMAIIAAVTALLVVGIQESANVNNVIVIIKVAIVDRVHRWSGCRVRRIGELR